MNFLTILGFSAATFTTIAFVPQLMRTWQTKSAKDVSLAMLVCFCFGVFLWIIYGMILNQPPIIVANIITLIFNLMILYCKLKYNR
jgi:MtN3 and saliva related transmembrane protein